MTISGSLETFSLPELFQIIDFGKKSGRLLFNIDSKDTSFDLKGSFELWFDRGNFVSIINSLNDRSLIAEEIEQSSWDKGKLLMQAKYNCPPNKALGECLIEQNAIAKAKIDSLFESQINKIHKLFSISSAFFQFEELDSNNKIPSDGKQFPYQQMTGKQKQASVISLEAMRKFSDWSRFADEMPTGDMGLQQLTPPPQDVQLVFLESYLWNVADRSTSLQDVARKVGISLEEVRQTALSMIFAGLVEETPVVKSNTNMPSAAQFAKQPAFAGRSSAATVTKDKSQVSKSLVNNLLGFLRNNF
ncbi:DUF4388 domain-containing protein [Myxosarcina sp. GI1]|uniref:DUF4388 domain-containing protein n=1 Tax=Myxosarcina sp. GI1 TaxID=1541065 RepID=UPI00055CD0D2|nr:DUF4388 domain-containing protein [Myxosarcina sp. GI1]